MRKLLVVFALLPIGTLLWPSLARAWECDPAISRGACAGAGQKFSVAGRPAVRVPVSSKRILVNVPIRHDNLGGVRSVSLQRIQNPASARQSMGHELSDRQDRRGVYGAAGALVPLHDGLRVPGVEAGMPELFSANRVVQTGHSRSQPGPDAASGDGDRVSPSSPSMNPAPQPGSGALLIAGFLGMCAVARRRISSILG